MRTVVIEVKVRMVLKVDEGIQIQDVVNDFDYDFKDQTGHCDVEDMEITDHEVVDSR